MNRLSMGVCLASRARYLCVIIVVSWKRWWWRQYWLDVGRTCGCGSGFLLPLLLLLLPPNFYYPQHRQNHQDHHSKDHRACCTTTAM